MDNLYLNENFRENQLKGGRFKHCRFDSEMSAEKLVGRLQGLDVRMIVPIMVVSIKDDGSYFYG